MSRPSRIWQTCRTIMVGKPNPHGNPHPRFSESLRKTPLQRLDDARAQNALQKDPRIRALDGIKLDLFARNMHFISMEEDPTRVKDPKMEKDMDKYAAAFIESRYGCDEWAGFASRFPFLCRSERVDPYHVGGDAARRTGRSRTREELKRGKARLYYLDI